MNLIVSAIGQGLLWALLGLGLYLTFRILNFADMTVEGTFPLGAAVAVANLAHGMSPYLATFLALLAGNDRRISDRFIIYKGKNSDFACWYFDDDCNLFD